MSESKIIIDPVFGFINVPKGLLLNIVKHPFMQRLRRIKQNGLASEVYPGAQHTRFQHSLGAFHLMTQAILTLEQKGIFIFDSEAEAVEAAILMHDIGHGPFSHVLEHTLINGISHEDISLMMMEKMNKELNGALTLAIAIFKNTYPKKFLHQLISSQLDMDRLDYLRRDSFFTGVNEASVGSARIIKMLNIVDDTLVVDAKGIYSIENYLTSRRLMYWQVYLHKTTVASEKVLINALLRAKELVQRGEKLFAPPALLYFLEKKVDKEYFINHEEAFENYVLLDDNDIWTALKNWQNLPDKILSTLAKNLINRCPFKVEVREEPISVEEQTHLLEEIALKADISFDEAKYFMSVDTLQKDMYNPDEDHISILYPNGELKDIAEASDLLSTSLLSKKIKKYYMCYQRFQ